MNLIILYLALFFIIVFLIIMYVKNSFYSPMFINKKMYFHSLNKKRAFTVLEKNFKRPLHGTKFTFNFWIYIDNAPENVCKTYSYNNFIPIFNMSNNEQFKLEINQHNNQLKLILGVAELKSTIDTKYIHEFVILDKLPNEKWINVSINIEDKYIDVFKDGILYNSFFSPSIIKFVIPADLKFVRNNDGFYGYLSKFRYFNKYIDYKRTRELYDSNKSYPGSQDLFWWLK